MPDFIEDLLTQIQQLKLENAQLIVERDQAQALIQRLQYHIDNHVVDLSTREDLIFTLVTIRGAHISRRQRLINLMDDKMPNISNYTKAQIINWLQDFYNRITEPVNESNPQGDAPPSPVNSPTA